MRRAAGQLTQNLMRNASRQSHRQRHRTDSLTSNSTDLSSSCSTDNDNLHNVHTPAHTPVHRFRLPNESKLSTTSSTNSSYSTISTQSSSLWSDIQTEDDTGSLGSLDSTDSALSSRSRGRSKVRRQWEKGERSQRADSSASDDRSRRTSRSRSMSRFGGRDRSRSAPPATQPTVILNPSNRANELEIDEDIQSLMDRFVHNMQKASLRSREWNTRFPQNTIIVYTDGSMVGNYHLSGIGIFHAPYSKLNKSQRILGTEHNSGLAELVAAREALRDILGFEGFHGQRVIVRSDYLGLIDAMQSPAYEGRFAAVVNEIKRMCERNFPAGVTFEHVYAHSEDVGNELADRLARVATRRDRSRSRSRVRVGVVQSQRSASANRTRQMNRQRSRSNDPQFIRRHSASVGCTTRNPLP